MKKVLYILVSCSLAVGCATRKADTQINKKDSTAVTSTKEVTQSKSDSTATTVTVDNTVTYEIEIKPLDSTKPLIVNGKSYFNAILRYKKQSNDVRTKQEIKVAKNERKEVKTNSKARVQSKEKEKHVKAVRFQWWWWLIVLLAVAVYLVLKKYKPII